MLTYLCMPVCVYVFVYDVLVKENPHEAAAREQRRLARQERGRAASQAMKPRHSNGSTNADLLAELTDDNDTQLTDAEIEQFLKDSDALLHDGQTEPFPAARIQTHTSGSTQVGPTGPSMVAMSMTTVAPGSRTNTGTPTSVNNALCPVPIPSLAPVPKSARDRCSIQLSCPSHVHPTCTHLYCTKCDMDVLWTDDHVWRTGVDHYLLLRNFYPDSSKLVSGMHEQEGARAYWCQCSWTNVTQPESTTQAGQSRWICKGRKANHY